MDRRHFLKVTAFALAAMTVPSASRVLAKEPRKRIPRPEYLLAADELILGWRESPDEDFLVTRTGTVASLYLWYEPMGMYLQITAESFQWHGCPQFYRPQVFAGDRVELGEIAIHVGPVTMASARR